MRLTLCEICIWHFSKIYITSSVFETRLRINITPTYIYAFDKNSKFQGLYVDTSIILSLLFIRYEKDRMMFVYHYPYINYKTLTVLTFDEEKVNNKRRKSIFIISIVKKYNVQYRVFILTVLGKYFIKYGRYGKS